MLKIKDCRKFMKKCKSCGKLKLISDFVKDSNTKEGYRNQCKICKNSKEKLRYSLVCLECGKEFTSGSKKQKFCSKECTIKNQYNKEEVLCEHCRKPIKLKKSEIKRNNHHFCSKKCYGEWSSKNKKGENHPLYKREEFLCDCCKKPIKLTKRYIERSNHHFCSKKCYNKWMIGENNHGWNPDLTDKDREKGRHIEGYKDFIRQVLKRDNYTCQITGKRGGKLEVHHLNCYSKFKEERTDINNAITLSKEIHKLFHKIYGNRNNTKEQFEEFKERYINKEFEEVLQ